ncbi:hypothetical protein GUJ93_ZPchr0001g29475 [Zizania palustris]|uniref:Uncharacterized protein n=1 Tax=Zizania palustris TaxID=103762 RepID=A0A8J5S418_ZIZPA|nr:hypothetical protein GUJ93_ZPchr0001g29475 [Zizania palustris]
MEVETAKLAWGSVSFWDISSLTVPEPADLLSAAAPSFAPELRSAEAVLFHETYIQASSCSTEITGAGVNHDHKSLY